MTKPTLESFASCVEAFQKFLPQDASPTRSLGFMDAIGATLAQDLTATQDTPPFNNSAMDGYAFQYTPLAQAKTQGEVTLKVVGIATAGHPFTRALAPFEAIRIMTGAPTPDGADTVVQIEKVRSTDTEVTFDFDAVKPQQNVRLRGELFRQGDTLVKAGTRYTEGTATLAASLGFNTLAFRTPPRVGVFANGDELVEPQNGTDLPEGKIFNSNGPLLTLLARRFGADAKYLGILPDEPDAIKAKLKAVINEVDIIVTSGGVGPGDKDFTSSILSELAQVEHHWMMGRPGKAIVVGRFNEGRHPLFIGFAGNPVAADIGGSIFVKRAIEAFLGAQSPRPLKTAKLKTRVKTRPGRRDHVLGTLETDQQGELWFVPMGSQNSASLMSIAQASAVAIIPEDEENPQPGMVVELF